MNYENEDQVISLKTMAFSVLRRWKAVILVALVLALALGGLRGVLTWREISNPEYRADQMENYQQAMEDYEAELERYTFQLDMIREDIRQQQDYIQNSVLMQADYRSVYVATAGLYVHAEDVETAASIAFAYRVVLLESSRIQAIAQALDMEPKYLRELIDLTSEGTRNPLLTIDVRHSSREGAQQILQMLLAELDAMHTVVENASCPHTVSPISGGISAEVDLDLADQQKDENDRLERYTDELDDYLKAEEVPVAPAAPALGMGAVAKSAIIFAVLGGVLGAFLVVAWACVAYVLGDQVYSGEEIQGRLGIRLLGKIALRGKKRCALDRWLDAKEHRAEFGDPCAYSMAAVNIRNHGTRMQPILVSGSADDQTVANYVEQLRKDLPELQILWHGSLLQSVEAVEQLPHCGGVLLVEQCGKSRYTAVARQIEAVRGVNQNLIGVVTLES